MSATLLSPLLLYPPPSHTHTRSCPPLTLSLFLCCLACGLHPSTSTLRCQGGVLSTLPVTVHQQLPLIPDQPQGSRTAAQPPLTSASYLQHAWLTYHTRAWHTGYTRLTLQHGGLYSRSRTQAGIDFHCVQPAVIFRSLISPHPHQVQTHDYVTGMIFSI